MKELKSYSSFKIYHIFKKNIYELCCFREFCLVKYITMKKYVLKKKKDINTVKDCSGKSFEKKSTQKKRSLLDICADMITTEPRFKDSSTYFYKERRKR